MPRTGPPPRLAGIRADWLRHAFARYVAGHIDRHQLAAVIDELRPRRIGDRCTTTPDVVHTQGENPDRA